MHHEALGAVRWGLIVWRPAQVRPTKDGIPYPSAGFRYRNGQHMTQKVAVALYEMRQHELLAVDNDHLTLTPAGWDRLSEWDETKQRTN